MAVDPFLEMVKVSESWSEMYFQIKERHDRLWAAAMDVLKDPELADRHREQLMKAMEQALK